MTSFSSSLWVAGMAYFDRNRGRQWIKVWSRNLRWSWFLLQLRIAGHIFNVYLRSGNIWWAITRFAVAEVWVGRRECDEPRLFVRWLLSSFTRPSQSMYAYGSESMSRTFDFYLFLEKGCARNVNWNWQIESLGRGKARSVKGTNYIPAAFHSLHWVMTVVVFAIELQGTRVSEYIHIN